MPDFQTLFAEVLRQRPDVTAEQLRGLLETKKQRVGAGFLTDQGALFLVASELGITLDHATRTDLSLADLYVGASEVTVVGRILTLYPTREYERRTGERGRYRRLILYDQRTRLRVTLWEEHADAVESVGLRPGDIARIRKGYVRAGLDSRPVLHLGTRGQLEKVENTSLDATLPPLVRLVRPLTNLRPGEEALVVEGLLRAPPRVGEFTRRDGSRGSVVQLYLGDQPTAPDVRVAIWDNPDPALAALPPNARIRIINLRSRLQPHGALELHGDDGTRAEILTSPIALMPSVEAPATQALHILAVGAPHPDRQGGETLSALVADATGHLLTLVAKGPAVAQLTGTTSDSRIRARTRALNPSTLIVDAEIEVLSSEGTASVTTDALTRKLNTLAPDGNPVFVEVIALSRPAVQEVTTRNGDTVSRGEVLVGDETGEIKLVAWREHATLLESLLPGQRLVLKAVTPRAGPDGATQLQLRAYSAVVPVR